MISSLSRLAIAGLAGLVVTAGCASSVTINHYMLSSHVARDRGGIQPDTFAPSIGLGPLTLPDMVDRPQLVLRTSEHRVVLAETHRWAGPLKTEIARVLAENLAHLLGSRSILSYPQRGAERADVRLSVDVQRFESILGKTATIDAIWTVQWTDGKQRTDRTHVQETVSDESYDALVAAHSRALLTVSHGIASTIREGDQATSLP
ncbi:MAG TPA: PqiC family protein [Nitrospira sp.]|nr:PqiC family protein [Nitrospira sp.]